MTNMHRVLIVNHRIKACGVQQFGRRVFDLAKRSVDTEFIYAELERPFELELAVKQAQPDFILYNWHRGTMPWLTEDIVKSMHGIKHYFMYHEEFTREFYDKYLFFGDYDFSGGAKFGDKKSLLPRPLFDYASNYPNNIPVKIGSFGFGFWQKGYHHLTKLVNDTFDNCELNFHMPYSHFGDPLHEQGDAVREACWKAHTNPGMRLTITHDFRNDKGILDFLAGNDINVFMYGENGEGISSVIDYALSVKRPIAISNSRMFRHIANDKITLENNSIKEILDRGIEPLDHLREQWSTRNFIKALDKEFE